MIKRDTLIIHGTRGIPASYGGFETFAEKLSLYLVDTEYDVIVYCQTDEEKLSGDSKWNDITLRSICVSGNGAFSTIKFDLRTVLDTVFHMNRKETVVLTLGYNTAIFSLLYRVFRFKNIINMDGIEWRRNKWNSFEKAWLYLNDWCACLLGNHLVADNPGIYDYLKKKVNATKITMIPYGADSNPFPDKTVLDKYGLKIDKYFLIIARLEPENSVLEIVRAFVLLDTKDYSLVVLGELNTETNDYHKLIHDESDDNVIFLGAIYDKTEVSSIRSFSRCYMHGHTVGGTNPSLVESLSSKTAVIAHNNIFNRWVVGDDAPCFSDVNECTSLMHKMIADDNYASNLAKMLYQRYMKMFLWTPILNDYKNLIDRVKNNTKGTKMRVRGD